MAVSDYVGQSLLFGVLLQLLQCVDVGSIQQA